MALGWFSLLKTVPWSDVIASAPVVADGAKKLWKSVASKKAAPVPPPVPVALATGADAIDALQAQISALESVTTELRGQIKDSTELIQALAQQNAELVQRAEANRLRLRWHSAAIAVLLVALLAVVALR